MTQFDLKDETLSVRRLKRIIETNKDASFAKCLLVFCLLTFFLVVGVIIVWLLLTQQHMGSHKRTFSSISVKKEEGTVAAPLKILHSDTDAPKVAADVDEIFQEHENEVILRDLKPEVRQVLRNLSQEKDALKTGRAAQKGSIENAATESAKNSKKNGITLVGDGPVSATSAQGAKNKHKQAAAVQNSTKDLTRHALTATPLLIVEGVNEALYKSFLTLPFETYFVVSPESLKRWRRKTAKNKTIKFILEIQMEPLNKSIKLSKNALKVGMTETEIEKILMPYLSKGAAISGIQNRMGSAFLADSASVQAFFAVLKRHNLMFIDALTGGYQIKEKAKNAGIPYLRKTQILTEKNAQALLGEKPNATQDERSSIFTTMTPQARLALKTYSS